MLRGREGCIITEYVNSLSKSTDTSHLHYVQDMLLKFYLWSITSINVAIYFFHVIKQWMTYHNPFSVYFAKIIFIEDVVPINISTG